jgi:hypothetical protein
MALGDNDEIYLPARRPIKDGVFECMDVKSNCEVKLHSDHRCCQLWFIYKKVRKSIALGEQQR